MSAHWMIGWTRPNSEFDVASELRSLGFGAFVPSIRSKRAVKCWSRNRGHGKTREEVIISPAFPRYMVFSTNDVQPKWEEALSRSVLFAGMTVVIRSAGDPKMNPAILPPAVARLLQGPLGDGVIEDLTATLESVKRFAQGQKVSVQRSGVPIPGVVVGHEGANVRVILSVLGGHREATVALESVEAA